MTGDTRLTEPFEGLVLDATPVPGERLADRVYRAVRRAIGDGDLLAGARLVETEVAEMLGVSRTPVREALRRLESDGVLASEPHRGFAVVDLLEDAAVVYQVRQRLEGLAAQLAAENITVPTLKELDHVQVQMERILDDDAPETLHELAVLNSVFHDTISEAASSPRLRRLVKDLVPQYVSRQVVTLYSAEQRRESFEGHRQILDALWRRDGELADRLVQEHLEKGKQVVLAQLARRRDTVPLQRADHRRSTIDPARMGAAE